MSKLPQFPVEGGCACDRVRYRLTEAPRSVYLCHCTDCQTITTSAFVEGAQVRADSLEILQGELKEWERIHTTSGARPKQYSCSHCGVRIYSLSDKAPGIRTLRAGTLDDTSWLNPSGSIWMQSAQPWVVLPEDMLRYEDGGDFTAIARKWQAACLD
jgi:hypothetical protein